MSSLFLKQLAVAAVVALFAGYVSADTIETLRDKGTGKVFAYKVAKTDKASGKVNALTAATEFLSANKKQMGISVPTRDLRRTRLETDDLGFSHIAYQQFHKKLKVLGGEVVVHAGPQGELRYVNAKVAENLPGSVKPRISKKGAMKIARRKAYLESPDAAMPVATGAELLILPLSILKNDATSPTLLAWKVSTTNALGDVPFEMDYFIDARRGGVVFELSRIMEIGRQVPDCARAPGDSNCYLDTPNPSYPNYYHGIPEGSQIPVPRGPHPDPNMPYYYGSLDADNMFTYLDAMHGFVQSEFGIDGANGNGGTATDMSDRTTGSVHYDTTAHPFCPYSGGISQSTGNIFACRGAVTPDFVGHEYTHAVERFSYTGWPTYYGERGALSEAYADAIGQSFENSFTGSTDWKQGTGNQSGLFFRDLINPGVLGYSGQDVDCTQYGYPANLCPMPDRFRSPFVYCGADNNGGVHRNSTILSHAFYAMAAGDTRLCNISPIGIEAATQVFYQAYRYQYISTSAGFNEAYYGIIDACEALYPAPLTVCDNVTLALQSVELNQLSKCSGGPTDIGPDCAVRSVSGIMTTRPDGRPANKFVQGETVCVEGWGGVPDRSVQLRRLTHEENRIPNSSINVPSTSTATIDEDGGFFVCVVTFQGATPYAYDLVMDGNSNAIWEEWADLSVRYDRIVNVDGDGLCYEGETWVTSEDCHKAPADCACAYNEYCARMTSDPEGPYECRRRRKRLDIFPMQVPEPER